MVTKYADAHGVGGLAQDFVANYMTTPAAQLALAIANGRYPANTVAGKQVHDPVLAQFGKAGTGGVPMPNIPQMASVWTDLGAGVGQGDEGRRRAAGDVGLRGGGAVDRGQDRLVGNLDAGRPSGRPASFDSASE